MEARIMFKRCSCGTIWEDRESFLRDPDIEPIGMTLASKTETCDIHYFFNHNHEACETTLAEKIDQFADLIIEPIPEQNLMRSRDCPRYCRTIEELKTCDIECKYAPFRRLLVDRILKKNI